MRSVGENLRLSRGAVKRKVDPRIGPIKRKGPSTHPTEPAYPCCIPALGELGEISPRGGSPISLAPERD